MAAALKWDSISPQLRSALKAVVFGLLVLLVPYGGFFGGLLFFFGALFLYFNPGFASGGLLVSFFTLLAISYSAARVFDGAVFLTLVPVFIGLFYLILAVKNLALLHRNWWRFVLFLSLGYGVLIFFFLNYSSFPFLFPIVIFTVFTALLHEYVRASVPQAFLFAFFILEAVLVVSLLPIGFINSASFSLVVIFVLTNVLRHMHASAITPRFLLWQATVFAFALLVIFGTSVWVI